MNVVPFMPVHLKEVSLYKYMSFTQQYLQDPEYLQLLMQGPCFSGIVDGKAIICSGMIQVGMGRYHAWGLLTEETSRYMLHIFRAMSKFLNENPKKRIEATVLHDFKAAHRLMEMLGFENETPNGMKAWGDDGKTYSLYARCL